MSNDGDGNICSYCDGLMSIRDGQESTGTCDSCAQAHLPEALEKLEAAKGKIDALEGALEKIRSKFTDAENATSEQIAVSAVAFLDAYERETISLREKIVALEAPIPMLLFCPTCGSRHLDEGDFATKVHHTHACQGCGMVWRPAVVPTVGVHFLPGFKNAEKP